ncbi:MAG: alpha/beta hydrolase [Anaerolineaceae bacterium]
MSSFQAKITLKILQLHPYSWAEGTIPEQRARLERLTAFLRIPKRVRVTPVDAAGVPAERISTRETRKGIILYLHGGAYALGSPDVHREFLARLSRACRMQVLALNYRLAPEHPFPAALEDCLSAWGWLLSQGFSPAEIALAGDSAGGGLAAAALLALRELRKELPSCAVLLSPWLDLSTSPGQSAARDPVLNPNLLDGYSNAYAAENDPVNPLISPLLADLGGLPPINIQVGEHEILLEQSRQFVQKAEQAGVEISLECWPGLFHVFQMVPILPESKHSLEKIAAFLDEKISANS